MKSKSKLTKSQLKKRCRNLVESEKAKVIFSTAQNSVKCISLDKEIFTVMYQKENTGNISLELKMNPLEFLVSFNVLIYVLEYFLEVACSEKYNSVTFNFESITKPLKYPSQTNIICSILKELGFKKEKNLYIYSTDTPFIRISEFIDDIKNVFSSFSKENPSFYFNISPYHSQFNLNSAKDCFFLCLINWFGYEGVIGFRKEENTYSVQEVMSRVRESVIELPFTIFTTSDMYSELFNFLDNIPQQMLLPNVLTTPIYQLKRLIKTTSSYKINAEEIMRNFEELGYSFLEIEDEAAKLVKDDSYFQEKKITPPIVYLDERMDLYASILKLHNHYLILMFTTSYPPTEKFAIVNSKEQIEETFLSLLEDIEKESLILSS